jgi:phosphoribosyl-AMP cyclohydrolase
LAQLTHPLWFLLIHNRRLFSAVPVEHIRYNDQGLVPAIVQDYLDGTVLMMAWMNRESLQKTLETGDTWFLEPLSPGILA